MSKMVTLGKIEKEIGRLTSQEQLRLLGELAHQIRGRGIRIKWFSSSKDAGIRAFFNREFVNKGSIEKKLGKFYSEMFDYRQEGDYNDKVSGGRF